MPESIWLLCIRAAGVFHLLTLAFACFTPIPANWDENLARLPDLHRRFALAQNFFIGAVIAFFGIVCLVFAPSLIADTTSARILCAAIALWWGGRFMVLPWLGVWPHLQTNFWRAGFRLLQLECATYALAFGWLAFRP